MCVCVSAMIKCRAVFVMTVEILIESDIKYYRQNLTRQRDAVLDLILLCMLRWDGEIKKKKRVAIWKREKRMGQSQRFN